MNIRLTAIEARIIGALIEKQLTTPDRYPLSLNALVNACNQKSNREPLMQLDEPTVKFVVDGLGRRHMAAEKSGFGSRVPKYQQIFCNTEFGSLKFTPQETAIVCELLLRGPQTPGELKAHSGRLHEFADPAEVDATLESLLTRSDGPFVARLPREPRRKDHAYTHLFSGAIESAPASAAAAASSESSAQGPNTVAALEARVAALEQEVAALKQSLGR